MIRERALPDSARDKVLGAASGQLLVGGQALAWWAAHYRLDPGTDFPDGVTFDFDFLGSAAAAKALHTRIGGKLFVANHDEMPAQCAKIYIADFEGQGPLEVDFMAMLIGGDEEGMRKRAVQLKLTPSDLLVLHPYDVLRTRIANLHTLSSRARNPRYVAQARLAIRVLHAYLKQALADGEQRLVLKIVEALGELACEPAGLALWKKQGLDVLDCVPHAEIAIRSFQERRWLQLRAHIQARRG